MIRRHTWARWMERVKEMTIIIQPYFSTESRIDQAINDTTKLYSGWSGCACVRSITRMIDAPVDLYSHASQSFLLCFSFAIASTHKYFRRFELCNSGWSFYFVKCCSVDSNLPWRKSKPIDSESGTNGHLRSCSTCPVCTVTHGRRN